MQTSKSAEAVEATEPEKRKQYRQFAFLDEDGDELEENPEMDFPYLVRNTDGEIRAVHNRREDPVLATVRLKGESYRLRQLDRHLLFRSLYSPPTGDALFLSDTTPAGFAETFRRRAPGRCIVHRKEDEYCGYYLYFYLFFETDGTGFAMHANTAKDQKRAMWAVEWDRVDFRWDDLPGMEDVLAAPVEDLREPCTRLFEERINRNLRMPVLDHGDLPRTPLTWLSGSEADFRWLTKAICLTEPKLMDAEGPIVVVYRAEMKGRRGCFLHVERGTRYQGDRYTSRRLMTLCELAFRLNPCTGTEWYDRSSSYSNHRQLQESALRLKIEIETPTAHEKAEAYLTLLDWIEDKLHDPAKRARCGLSS